jgi:hypothetical protein
VGDAPVGLLGPDVFGLRRAPEPPPFLAGVDQTAIPTNQLTSFFSALDMTHPGLPTDAELRLDTLLARDETMWRSERGQDRRSWAPDANSLPEDLRELPEVIEMPLVFHLVWLGGPLGRSRSGLWNNPADLSRQTWDWARVVLWTDVPRDVIAQTEQPPASSGPDPLRDVREMVAWAERNGI